MILWDFHNVLLETVKYLEVKWKLRRQVLKGSYLSEIKLKILISPPVFHSSQQEKQDLEPGSKIVSWPAPDGKPT
ncbi:hypothetical protein GRJ2_000905600 [Grus japonensis]|uniref:Uncharacterized protein n=1 Tax=Grus japonensis TaxID=30415 RepID=A0ABC9WGP2_GRUJA